MEKKKLQKGIILSNIIILVIAIVLFILNLDFVSVIHAQASEWIPVIVYATYSSTEISLLYILIILTIVNLLLIIFRLLEQFRPYVLSLIPIIALISIILLFLNPHTIILTPEGWPPTILDNIQLGGFISIILFSIFILSSFLQLFIEEKLKKSLKVIGLIIGAILLSDFIHESGHAVMALLAGGEISEFYPFPVLLGREFAAGYVGFSNVPTNLIPLVLLGGEIFQWISICIILVFIYFKPKYRKSVFIITLLTIALLDFPFYVINNTLGLPHWFLIGGINGDILIFSELTGFPLWAFIIIACVQLLITVLILYFFIFKSRMRIEKEDFKIE
jgi:hypothetical protein